MKKKLLIIFAFTLMGYLIIPSGYTKTSASQDVLAAFKGNNCVECHSRLMNPLKLTSRYGEWHISTHKDKGVSCDKCHGGDPSMKDEKKAHTGILPTSNPQSKMNPKNLPETCTTCHQQIVAAFVGSKHYQSLKATGLGPSCSTCHQHMVTQVVYSGEDAAKLCASCHDSANSSLPKRPEIADQADEAMQAIRRASLIVVWTNRLLEEAHNKKVDVAKAEQEMKVVQGLFIEAKASFHAYNLDAVRKKADEAHQRGTKIKDELRAKLYPNQ
ncbi:MAG: hypothetical protein IPJ07_15930 [Acidobacteria bacterium]|nr:hypothetical protein [Acidobacteriota bacterium]